MSVISLNQKAFWYTQEHAQSVAEEFDGWPWCRNVISATPRQLESLIRLSEALARLELQEEVAERHVAEALRLMKVSMQQSAMDHRTGMIDMDKLYSGVGALDREMRRHLASAISELLIGAPPAQHSCSTVRF